jgi:hypothetical protein
VAATITPAPLSVYLTNTGVTKTYDGTIAAPTGFTPIFGVGGFVAGDTAATIRSTGSTYNSAHVAIADTLTVSGLSFSGVVGSNGSLTSDYRLVSSSTSAAAAITPALLTAYLTSMDVTKTYDGTTNAPAGFTPSFALSGFIAGDTAATVRNTGSAYNSAHVAFADTISVSGLSFRGVVGSNGSLTSDYRLASSSASGPATITPAVLTAYLNNTDVSKPYDGTTNAPVGFAPSFNVSGFIAGDTATTIAHTGSAYNSAHVLYADTISVNGLSFGSIVGSNASLKSDYRLDSSSSSGPATITPAALTVSLANTGVTKTYDGTTAAPVGFAPSLNVGGLVAGDSATIGYAGSAYNNAHVLYADTISVNGLSFGGIVGSNASLKSDYRLTASSASGPAAITPAALGVALVGPVTKNYDGTAAAALTPANFTLLGFVAGDTASINQTVGAYASANPGSGIDVSAVLGSGNYLAGGATQLADYALQIGIITGIGIGTIK